MVQGTPHEEVIQRKRPNAVKQPATRGAVLGRASTNTQRSKKQILPCSRNREEGGMKERSWWESHKKEGHRALGPRNPGAGSCLVGMATSLGVFPKVKWKPTDAFSGEGHGRMACYDFQRSLLAACVENRKEGTSVEAKWPVGRLVQPSR